MNWLAHVYLSDDDVEFRLGNILADVVKGKHRKELSPGIRHGMECHRAIDAFTDYHPLVYRCKEQVQLEHRHYAGIVLDVYFDHLLANHWENYCDVALPEYLSGVYKSFLDYADRLPEPADTLIRRIAKEDWFGNYRYIGQIEFVLTRMAKRMKRPPAFAQVLEQLRNSEPKIQSTFHHFFVELSDHVGEWKKLNPAGNREGFQS